jgi:hypothetical protein
VVILHIAFESTERKTLLEYLGCTFQGSWNPGASYKFDFVPDSSHGDNLSC